jgi:hypothetical protein
MSEVTNRIDLNEFAKSVDSTPKQVLQNLDELSRIDLVKKTGGGYGITEKGRTLLKANTEVPEGMEFNFYLAIGQPTNLKAQSIKEFSDQIRKVDISSLEFHLYRNDFENWFRIMFNDNSTSEALSKTREATKHGEELREEILKIIEAKYPLDIQKK